MSRRSFIPSPRIAPSDLRDHADDARIARVWDRIEQDLEGVKEARPSRNAGIAMALIAATMAAFGAGLVVGKVTWRGPAEALFPDLPSPERSMFVDVLAAGSRARTVPLPGGGWITLAPETTVEVERTGEGTLTLRLVRGEASVDTAEVASPELSIVAGDARLSAATGSVVRVHRKQNDMMDVIVSDGSVQLTSPAGSRWLYSGDIDSVSTKTDVAAVPTAMRPRSIAPARPLSNDAAEEQPQAAAAAAPDWRGRAQRADYAGAMQIIKQQHGGLASAITSARSAGELMDLYDVARATKDQAAVVSALTRVLDGFRSDPMAPLAAHALATHYEKINPQKSRMYLQELRRLSPDSTLAEDALCKQIRASNKDESIRLANDYLNKYPNGPCKEYVDGILAGGDAPAEEEGSAPAASSTPDGAAPPPVAPHKP